MVVDFASSITLHKSKKERQKYTGLLNSMKRERGKQAVIKLEFDAHLILKLLQALCR
jgi:hypothetical protein